MRKARECPSFALIAGFHSSGQNSNATGFISKDVITVIPHVSAMLCRYVC
jgi:hypothetical protein